MTAESPERNGVRKAILAAIDDRDDGGDDTARISDVVDDALANTRHAENPSGVFEAFAVLFRSGEVYEPKPGHVRRTNGPRDPGGES